MLKNMKLGLKIGLGFGIVLIIAAAIGLFALVSMQQIRDDSTALAEGYVPEWVLAGGVLEHQMRAGYYAVAYSFNYEADWLRNARSEMTDLTRLLQDGRRVASGSVHQQDIIPVIDEISRLVAAYGIALDDTETAVNAILASRAAILEQGRRFEEQILAYVNAQTDAMYRQIDSADTQTELRIRQDRINAGNDILDLGNRILINTWHAEAFQNSDGVLGASRDANRLVSMIEGLISVTRQEVNLRQLNDVRAAVLLYGRAVDQLVAAAEQAGTARADRLRSYNAVLSLAAEFVDETSGATTGVADAAVERVETAVLVLMVGLILALLVGILVTIVITRGITNPVSAGVVFARRLASGDMTGTLDVNQKDEIGVLAEALREMADNLKRTVISVRSASDNVAAGSQQMSSTAQEMSQGATEQAAAAEEVSSS
ncbi:MAG: methyl-accepting chemotaxis protein, partial [Spirochaetaceae bacterium]